MNCILVRWRAPAGGGEESVELDVDEPDDEDEVELSVCSAAIAKERSSCRCTRGRLWRATAATADVEENMVV